MANSEGRHHEARGAIDAMLVGAGSAGLDAEPGPEDHPPGARRPADCHNPLKGDTP